MERAERGMMLVPVMFMVLLLGGLSLALLVEVQGDRVSLDHHETSVYALEVAEAGLARAELEIMALRDSGTDGIGFVSGTLQNGSYAITATSNVLSADRWVLVARGVRDLSARRVEVGLRRRPNGNFVEAIFSRDQLDVNGSLHSDSFDSRVGPYALQAINLDSRGNLYARANGSLGSNKDIKINGTNVALRGHSIAGPLHDTLQSGTPLITGDTVPRTEEINLPDPTLAEFQNALANNNNNDVLGKGPKNPNIRYDDKKKTLDLTSAAILDLPAGTYFFSDISLTASSQILVTGNVKIYATGNVSFAGQGITNLAGPAAALEIKMHRYALPADHPPNTTKLSLTGGSNFTGTIYAPGVNVDLGGNMHMYGAVVGKKIDVNGTVRFHYDEALGATGTRGSVLVERLYWRDLAPPAR